MPQCRSCGMTLKICPDCKKVGCMNPNCSHKAIPDNGMMSCGVCGGYLEDYGEYTEKQRRERERASESAPRSSISSSESSYTPSTNYSGYSGYSGYHIPSLFEMFMQMVMIAGVIAFFAFCVICFYWNYRIAFGVSMGLWAVITGVMSWFYFKPTKFTKRTSGKRGTSR